MALGIIGIEIFQTTTQGTIAKGESINISGYTLTFENLEFFDTSDGRNTARASVLISNNGQDLQRVFPASDYYYASQQSVTIPGVRSTLADDVYIILVDWEPITSDSATFKIFRNPLINWLWIGSVVLVLGTLLALWPARFHNKPAPVQEETA